MAKKKQIKDSEAGAAKPMPDLGKRLARLRNAERQAFYNWAAMQGRIAEVEFLLAEMGKAEGDTDGDDTGAGALSGGGS